MSAQRSVSRVGVSPSVVRATTSPTIRTPTTFKSRASLVLGTLLLGYMIYTPVASTKGLHILGKLTYKTRDSLPNARFRSVRLSFQGIKPPIRTRCLSTTPTADADERVPRKVVFMGTPGFAVPALKQLLDSKHEVVAVYSQPPRPSGRGKKLRKSPVHELAEEAGIPVYTPVSLKKKAYQEEFDAIEADIACVTAYGLLLPKRVLDSKEFGCVNIHPSLLPRWRGAAPLPWSIIAGDEQTGVCIMQLDEGMDTGPILARHEIDLVPGTTCGELHDLLAAKGAEMLVDVVDRIHTIHPVPQEPEEAATHARKIQKQDGKLDFSKPARELFNLIHGLSPVPGAFFEHKGINFKVLKADLIDPEGEEQDIIKPPEGIEESEWLVPGRILDNKLTMMCGDGKCVRPVTVQKPGKRAMETKDFLNGNPLKRGTLLAEKIEEGQL